MLPVSDESVDGEASPVDISTIKPVAPESGPEHHSKHLGKDPTPVDTAIYEPLAPGHADKANDKSPENADDKSLEEVGQKSVMIATAEPEAANTSTATGKQSNKGLPSSAHEAVWRVLEDMLLLKHKF